MNTPLKRTPLYAAHVKAGARMVEFGGWHMPVQYTGIIEEHRRVRASVGLFDVSHMGEFEIEGPEALAALQTLTTNDVAALDAQGELGSFRTLQKQPAQRGRTIEQQLRRFMGSRSYRKIRYARLLVDALDLTRVPIPLDRLLSHV